MQHLWKNGTLDDLLAANVAVIYKHSPICGASDLAIRQVEAFARAYPSVPVYLVDVIRNRAVSDQVAQRLGVGHASPQTIVVRQGKAWWNASHSRITAHALIQHATGS
ncbi:MAG: bacillithiol system redox-active protein YtxJ [Gemmatimonadetes bacterium]|nr:bacillithiol system redox-active protein YtxJ [Gemmatimonadota bacterium]